VQADVHDRPVLPVGGPTLDRTEWGKDPGLELGFDPVLDQIQYLAENGLTSLMVLHNFLSKRLAPLQDRSHRPAWIYTGVNDIMWLDRGPRSSQGDTLLAASVVPPHTSSKSRKGAWRTSMRYRISYSFRPHLPTELGSGATTCPAVPDLTSLLR
jgi:hypothetical protein